jgi:ABC-type uncharacterized transport system ATPase subunit
MSNIIINNKYTGAKSWEKLLEFYFDTQLQHNTSYEKLREKAKAFTKQITNTEKIILLETHILKDLFVFPESISLKEETNFIIGFNNFLTAIQDYINNTEVKKFEGSKRMASPPLKAYELVGMNKDLKPYKSDYTYLFE